jgi:hypothetical protein
VICAACGDEIRRDWIVPQFSLCERCEEQLRQADNAWEKKDEQPTGTISEQQSANLVTGD